MNYERLKKYAFALAVAVMLVSAAGPGSQAVVKAQNRDWDQGRRDDRDRYGNSRDEQKGYHDGLNRGREDARDRRIPDPSNSSHYRKGNDAYRAGFRHGYQQGYRRNVRIWGR
jgi:hypothetical protein